MLTLTCWIVALSIICLLSLGATVAAAEDIVQYGRHGDFGLLWTGFVGFVSSSILLAIKLGLISG
jgi:hypothetical protein